MKAHDIKQRTTPAQNTKNRLLAKDRLNTILKTWQKLIIRTMTMK